MIELGRTVAEARKLCEAGLSEFRLGRVVLDMELLDVCDALTRVQKVLTAAEPPTVPEPIVADPVLTANVLKKLEEARKRLTN